MDLLFPTTPEVITAIECLLTRAVKMLQEECKLTIAQYRVLSCLHRARPVRLKTVSKMLSMTPSMASQTVHPLINEKLVTSTTSGTRLGDLTITQAGMEKRHYADLVVMQLCNELFFALSSEEIATMRTGTLITNRLHGPMRMKKSDFFSDYSVFESFLTGERLFIDSSRKAGHSLSEVRLLYELLEYGPMTCTELSRRLMLSKQAISVAAARISEQGWVHRLSDRSDKRIVRLALTVDGRTHTEELITALDQRASGDVRAWNPGETRTYAEMSAKMVELARKQNYGQG